MPSLKAARAGWFLVWGDNNGEGVRPVVYDVAAPRPGARAPRLDTEVLWLLDDAAARLLKTG